MFHISNFKTIENREAGIWLPFDYLFSEERMSSRTTVAPNAPTSATTAIYAHRPPDGPMSNQSTRDTAMMTMSSKDNKIPWERPPPHRFLRSRHFPLITFSL
jgi:hypothetical protein